MRQIQAVDSIVLEALAAGREVPRTLPGKGKDNGGENEGGPRSAGKVKKGAKAELLAAVEKAYAEGWRGATTACGYVAMRQV